MGEPDDPLLFDVDLGGETDNATLYELIRAEIRAAGPMTFERFMRIALYEPGEGYYCSPRVQIGPGGDFLTAPEVSPLFGFAIARQMAELWRSLGTPAAFDLVEAGAGNGTLARDILRWAAARERDFYAALRYTLVEQSASMRGRQEELLARWCRGGKVRIYPNLDAFEPGAVEGCILANELIDSFPVHRVRLQKGCLRELYVDLVEGRLVEREGELSTRAIGEYFERLGLLPGEGCVAEVNLDGPDWLRRAGAVLRRGYLLLLDYGYAAERLFAPWRRNGTLLCFRRHEASEDPYVRLGRQDMTAHVDFTSLAWAAAQVGLTQLGLTDQRNLLAALGIGEAVQLDPSHDLAVEEFYARRRAVSVLLDANGLGRVGVLCLAKDVKHCALTGFPTP